MLSMIKSLVKGKRAEKEAAERQAPDKGLPRLLGLRLGGSVRLDDLFLKMTESNGLMDGPRREVLIQSLGIIKVDQDSTLLRFYTNDDGFIQVNVEGALVPENVIDVTLWYFSHTQGVQNQARWEEALRDIPQPTKAYEGHTYDAVWDMTYDRGLVSVSETVHTEDGDTYVVDEFFMLYQRKIVESPETYELLLVNGEEKVLGSDMDRCVVTSIGYHLSENNFSVIS